MDSISNITLNKEEDVRTMRFRPYKNFSVKACYYAMNFGGVTTPHNTDIWKSLAPKKCKIFAWLVLHDRLNNRERLARRGVLSEPTCPFGYQCDENLSHLLFLCPHANIVWQIFLIPVQNGQGICSMQDIITSLRDASPLLRKEWVTIFIAIALGWREIARSLITLTLLQEDWKTIVGTP
jgi:hypothetical protein